MIVLVALILFLFISTIADEINWYDWEYFLMHKDGELPESGNGPVC